MENASKALLIVATVLIVILLISIGFRIFNPSQNVQEQVNDVGEKVSETVKNLSVDTVAELKGNLLKIESEFVVRGTKRIDVNLEPGRYLISVEDLTTNGIYGNFLIYFWYADYTSENNVKFIELTKEKNKKEFNINKKVDHLTIYARRWE